MWSLFGVQPIKEIKGVIAFELFDKTIVHEERDNTGVFSDINISLWLFKTDKQNISMETVGLYDAKFKRVDKNERFQNNGQSFWLKVDLGKNFPSGMFVASYGDAKVLEQSFSKQQNIDIFDIGGTEHLKFSYDAKKDSSVYYFKISSSKYKNAYRYLFITTKKSFYQEFNDSVLVTL